MKICCLIMHYIYIYIIFVVGPKRKRNIFKRVGPRRGLYLLLIIWDCISYIHTQKLLVKIFPSKFQTTLPHTHTRTHTCSQVSRRKHSHTHTHTPTHTKKNKKNCNEIQNHSHTLTHTHTHTTTKTYQISKTN